MKRSDWRSQWMLVKDYCRMGYRRVLVYMAVLGVLEGLRPYISMILMGALLDAVYAGKGMEQLLMLTAAALGTEGVMALINGFLYKGFNKKLEYMYEQQNALLASRCLDMDYEYLEDPRIHEALHSMKNANTNQGLMGWVLNNWFKMIRAMTAIFAAVIIVIPMFVKNTPVTDGILTSWVSSLALVTIIAAMIGLSYHMDLRYGIGIKECNERRASHESVLEYYMGIFSGCERQKDLRIYGQREQILASTDKAIDHAQEEIDCAAGLAVRGEVIRRTVSGLTGLLVYAFSGMRAWLGLISVGNVVTYAASILRMSTAVAELMSALARTKNHSRYCQDYVEFSQLGKKKYEGTLPVEKRRDNRFSVEFDHVSFRYPGTEEYVIRDLSLKFVIGERMAIVGKNGSGKTTFIKLLCRLYDVTEGAIKVNGIDIRKYDYEEYCRLFSVVFQDFRMFSFALGENIACSDAPDADRVRDALNRAGLEGVLGRLPQGLGTYVGKEFDEQGVSFSGGEKQKMAIARAIYKDAPFVIMDEPTAALDPVSEYEVYAGFDKMVGNKTAIYISHRLASCRFCQDILVFDKGQVVQRGSHEELEVQPGLYRQLWQAQAQYYTRNFSAPLANDSFSMLY